MFDWKTTKRRSEKITKNIVMENDANCFVMAESKLGATKNFDLVFGVIMGTGVGGGITINGKLHVRKNQYCWRMGTSHITSQ